MAADAASRKKSIEELLFNGGRNDDDETSGVDSTPNVSDSDLRTLSAKKSPRRGRDGSADSRDRELERKSSAKYARRRSLSQNARGRSLPPTSAAVWKSNLQPDFNVRVFECFDTSSSAVLRELDKSNRLVQKSAESTPI